MSIMSAPTAQQQPLFAALADPTRRALLENLAANSPKTATRLAQEFPITRQGILKHLDILEAAGLVAVRQQGREKRYELTPEPLEAVEAWVETIGEVWERRLGRLKRLVEGGGGGSV